MFDITTLFQTRLPLETEYFEKTKSNLLKVSETTESILKNFIKNHYDEQLFDYSDTQYIEKK